MNRVMIMLLIVFGMLSTAFAETPKSITKEVKYEIKVKTTEDLKAVNWESVEEFLNKFDSDYKKRIVVVVEDYKPEKRVDDNCPMKFTAEVAGSKSAKKIIKRTKLLIKGIIKSDS